MTRLMSMALAGCDQMAAGMGGGATAPATGGGPAEYMVPGGAMSFEACRARGGLIIRDSNTAMVACDPRVARAPVPQATPATPTLAG